MPTQPLLPSVKPTGTTVNLLHLKLFHHFQTCTLPTLLLGLGFWEHAFQLCFHFEYLMNAVLCISARHLTILQPDDATYPTAAANHLCRALSLFRRELSNTFTSIHIDAFLVTSILLQYEVWISTDFVSLQDDNVVSFDPSRDQIFTLSSGLKQVLLKSIPNAVCQPSIILPYIASSPANKLIDIAQISNDTLAKYQILFSPDRPLSLEMLKIPLPYIRGTELADIHHAPDPVENGYGNVIAALCLILSFLPEARPQDHVKSDSSLLPELARYIFLFPVLCRGPFASKVQQSNPQALLLLYHFYRGVRILLPPSRYWWASKRASVAETVLKEWLTREIDKQTDVLSVRELN